MAVLEPFEPSQETDLRLHSQSTVEIPLLPQGLCMQVSKETEVLLMMKTRLVEEKLRLR